MLRCIIRTFNELHYLETEYSIKGSEDSHETEIIFKNDIPFAYLDYTTDADFVYLVYMGNLLKKNTDMKDYPNWIVKFDWNCNLVEKYYINVYVLSISKSAKDNILYITVLNNEENPMLLKLQKTKL